MTHELGNLQVFWNPQIGSGCPSFEFAVSNVEQGAMLLVALAEYDLFQFHNRIKPDYCNAGGLQRWTDDCDGDGNPGWEDWYDEETDEDDPIRFVEDQRKGIEK